MVVGQGEGLFSLNGARGDNDVLTNVVSAEQRTCIGV